MIKYTAVFHNLLKYTYSKIVSGPPLFGFIERKLWIWLLFIPLIYIVQSYWFWKAWR
ncbi:MAG: hypothetical protein M0Z61_17790 [Nitrospiraceae bacterium]|nr:hypothetical protein [Nitrospiraceae bacterium]